MKVKEIMTARSLKFCSPETKLHNAAKTMKAGNCGALPVLNKEKKVIGLITDRDIALSLAQKQAKSAAQVNVAEIMAKKVHTVNSNDEITTALRQMRTNRIGRLPVVDKKGTLKGIVSLHNLISQANGKISSKVELGTFSSSGENLLKTMQAITSRYSNGRIKK
jgi:CBS-domain-containing membrane protein